MYQSRERDRSRGPSNHCTERVRFDYYCSINIVANYDSSRCNKVSRAIRISHNVHLTSLLLLWSRNLPPAWSRLLLSSIVCNSVSSFLVWFGSFRNLCVKHEFRNLLWSILTETQSFENRILDLLCTSKNGIQRGSSWIYKHAEIIIRKKDEDQLPRWVFPKGNLERGYFSFNRWYIFEKR